MIIHKKARTADEILLERCRENLKLTPKQRMEKMFELSKFAIKMKGGPLKKPQGKGIVLSSDKDESSRRK
ncbi:MAG: hypothetical protein JKY53_04955 [Flavobacteriales bacterium]|nr:hypothetical protein [Flavobacteriales bacterium]